ncbi:MAG: histidine kinase dimerization/phospho-acceptor domain-containing protein, partial [Myxococcaceae bacterium]
METRAREPARVFEIAYHFDAAGDPASALPYALAAADQARAQHALELAEQQYRIAERGSTRALPATRERIAEGLGDVLMLRGRYDESERAFESAGVFAQTDLGRARIQGKLADVAFRRGDVRNASPQFERALRMLGNRVPRRSLAFVLALLWELGVQLLHSLLPRAFLARRPGPIPAEELLSFHLYSRLTHAYFFQRGRVPTAWGHLRGMNLAERYPPSLELAQAYSEHGPVMTMLPNFKRGIAYVRRSYDIRRQKGDLWGQGQSLTFYGVVLYAASRFEEAIETFREAQRLLRRTGDLWQMNTARGHTAYSLYRLGRMAEAVDLAKRLFEESLELGDVMLTGIMLGIWGKAAGGRVPEEPYRVERYRKAEDLSTLSEIMQGDAMRLLRQERPADAAAVLERAHRMVKEGGLRQEYVAPIDPWLATALRLELERTPLYAPARRHELLRRASRAARGGLRIARKYRNNLPHALRERGLLYAAAGHSGKAVRLLDESLRLAELQKARHERAQTLLARGRLGVELGLPEAAEQVAEAERELGDMESPLEALAPTAPGAEPVTISLAERFDQILDLGRQIASAMSRDAVYAAVRNAALVLLRGERCVLLEAHAGRAMLISGERRVELNRGLLERAVETCSLAVRGEAPPELALEGPEAAGARSVLIAPILVRGRPAVCFYATHSLANVFGDEEQRLAKFITALAGAALENAEGFTEIRALSDERARLASEAQDAVRARDDFLLVAAHELRTPLTPLALMVQSLQRAAREASPVPPSELARRLETMERSVRRFERLVINLLDISRISAGRMELDLEEVNLGALTRDVLERHRGDLAKARCALSFRVLGQATGQWDPLRLEQVIGNLLSNAVKFGAGRPIEVEVDGEGETVRLIVRDHGFG